MAGISTILTHGPNALRTKAAAEDALAILAAHGWTVEVSQRPRIIKAVGEVSRESLSEIQTPRSGRPAAKVANPAKIRTPDPETLANLATLAAGNAQTTNLDRQLKECAPPQLNEAEIEERKGMASDSVPEPYLDAWARFQLQCPPA